MSSYQGDILAGSLVEFDFNTNDSTGAPITLAGTPALSVYKGSSTTESTSGVTLTVDHDSRTGRHHVKIDTSADGTFYAAGNDFSVVITTGTVSSVSAVGVSVGTFSIENRTQKADIRKVSGSAIPSPGTSGVLDVNAKYVNSVATSSVTTINANVGTTQPVNFTGTGASALAKSDMVDIAGAAVSATTAQLGVNLVNIAGSAVNTAAAQLGVNVVNLRGSATAAATLAAAYSLPYVPVPASTTSYTLITGAAAGSVIDMDTSATHAWANHIATCAAGVTLIGNNATVTSSASLDVLGPIITIGGDNVTISGLRIIGTSTTVFQAAVGLNGSAMFTDMVIENCDFDGFDTDVIFVSPGVAPSSPPRVTIRGNKARAKFDVCVFIGPSSSGAWFGMLTIEGNDFESVGPSVVDPGDTRGRPLFVGGDWNVVSRNNLYRVSGVAGGASAVTACIMTADDLGTVTLYSENDVFHATGNNARSILRAASDSGAFSSITDGVAVIRAAGNVNATPALPSFVTLLPVSAVIPADGSITTTKAPNLDAAVSTRSTFAGGAVASVTGNVGGNVAGSVGSVTNIVAQTADVGARIPANLVMTSGKVWALDGSGNALAPAAATAAIQGKTDQLTFTTANVVDASGGGGDVGTGDIPVNQDTGGTDTLRYTTSGGSGIDGADVYAYLTAEWAADPAGATVRGHVRTGSDGRWTENMMLDAGAYTFVFVASGYEVATVAQVVA